MYRYLCIYPTRGSTLCASVDIALDSRTCAYWHALRAAASGSRTRTDGRPTGWSAGRPGRRMPGLGSACLDPLAVLALRSYGHKGRHPWAQCAGRRTHSRVGVGTTQICHALLADDAKKHNSESDTAATRTAPPLPDSEGIS